MRLLVLLCLAGLPFHAAHAASETSLKVALARIEALPAAARFDNAAFSRRPRLREVTLSPDGAWVAYLDSADGQNAQLNLLNPASREKKRLLTLSGRAQLHWSNDSTLLFIDSGDGLSVVPAANGASSRIAAFDSKREQRFVAVDARRPHHALTEEHDRVARRYRLHRVGADGSRELMYEGQRRLHDFLADGAGQLSFIRTLDDDYTQLISRKQAGKWTEVTRCERLRACSLVAASSDGRLLTMAVKHQDDRKALLQLDLGRNTRRLLHSDPAGMADLKHVLLSPRGGQPLFAVYDLPARRNYGLTGPARQAAADIAKRFPDSNIAIAASEDAPRWLLTESGARLSQERYWIYDRARRAFDEILQRERQLGDPLPEQQLAQKIALRYRASDGALVHGYLSLPPGKKARALPLMALVHGGPWGRFENDYSAIVQLMVNRGFAVFQPNFRASTGYGDKYTLAPGADFGNGRVQADIIDGVHWLLARGVGDRRRLGIMGDSFGGYATLLALSHTPDLFQFGMASVPPTDFLRSMKRSAAAPPAGDAPPFAMTLAELGIDIGDRAAMKPIADAAPAVNAGKVAKPVLILAGGKDNKVEIAAVTDYVARLQGMGKPVSLLVDPDEGHNPHKPIVREAYAYLLQRMLHKYLGGPDVAAPSPELARYLGKTMKANGAL